MEPAPRILDWAPPEPLPLPDETPAEDVRNALVMAHDLETRLSASGRVYDSEMRAALAALKRRLGWAVRKLEAGATHGAL